MSSRTRSADISNNEEALLAARKEAIESLGTTTVKGTFQNMNSFVLPDGREVVMAAPSGGIVRKVAIMLNDTDANMGLLLLWLKAMMHVQSIDGSPMPTVNTIVDAQRIADVLGAVGEEIALSGYQEFWPAISIKDLQAVKK